MHPSINISASATKDDLNLNLGLTCAQAEHKEQQIESLKVAGLQMEEALTANLAQVLSSALCPACLSACLCARVSVCLSSLLK